MQEADKTSQQDSYGDSLLQKGDHDNGHQVTCTTDAGQQETNTRGLSSRDSAQRHLSIDAGSTTNSTVASGGGGGYVDAAHVFGLDSASSASGSMAGVIMGHPFGADDLLSQQGSPWPYNTMDPMLRLSMPVGNESRVSQLERLRAQLLAEATANAMPLQPQQQHGHQHHHHHHHAPSPEMTIPQQPPPTPITRYSLSRSRCVTPPLFFFIAHCVVQFIKFISSSPALPTFSSIVTRVVSKLCTVATTASTATGDALYTPQVPTCHRCLLLPV